MRTIPEVNELSEEFNLPKKEVLNIYKSFWSYIKDTIQELPLKEELSEKEFSEYRTNFNIKHLGKLNLTYRRYKGIKKRYKLLKILKNEKAKESKTNV